MAKEPDEAQLRRWTDPFPMLVYRDGKLISGTKEQELSFNRQRKALDALYAGDVETYRKIMAGEED